MRNITIIIAISLLPLFAQEDFLKGVRAEDLTLDRIEIPSAQDTAGISDWSKYFFNTGNAVISPDGRLLAEVRTKGGYINGIWIVDLKTEKEKQIDSRGFAPKWSPGGKLIAFLKQKVLVGKYYKGRQLYGEDELWVCKPDGSDKKRLTTHTHISEFVWGPAGEYIYFQGIDSTGRKRESSYIGRIDITTGKKEVIDIGSPYNDIGFSLSPDGRMIAYCKPLKWKLMTDWWVTDAEIFIANVDGTGKTQITKTKEVETMVKWLEDGKSLIVEQVDPDPFDSSYPKYAKLMLKKK